MRRSNNKKGCGRLYAILIRTRIFRGAVYSLENRISVLYPQNKDELSKSAVRMFIKIAMIYFLIAAAAFASGIPPYMLLVLVLVFYVVTSGYLKKSFFDAQTALLVKFERFVSDLRYKYQLTGMLHEAFTEAMDNADYQIMLHGELMLSCIEDIGGENGDDYKDIAPDSFFYTLYSLCRTLIVYGDKKEGDKSLFMDNLGYLKEDIYVEILKRQKIKSKFSGLTLTSLAPVLCIRPIEIWSVGNMPELRKYFEGTQGRMMTVFLIILSLGIYKVLVTLKYPGNKHSVPAMWGKLAAVPAVRYVTALYMRIRYKSCSRLNMRFNEMAYPYTVNEFILKRWVYTIAAFMWSCLVFASIGVNLLWSFPVALLIFHGMYAEVLIEESVIRLGREEEIVRFQNIILMLMEFERISVIQILEQMELFAVVFKRKIESMTDGYPYKGMKVFAEMHDECRYPPFERLLEGFMACDTVPVGRAFADIKSDRSYYMEKHKQDNDNIISNKGAIARILAYIPLYAVIIFKLIVPFVIEGMGMINQPYM